MEIVLLCLADKHRNIRAVLMRSPVQKVTSFINSICGIWEWPMGYCSLAKTIPDQVRVDYFSNYSCVINVYPFYFILFVVDVSVIFLFSLKFFI